MQPRFVSATLAPLAGPGAGQPTGFASPCAQKIPRLPDRSRSRPSLHVADRLPKHPRHEHQRRLDVAKVTAGYTSEATGASAKNCCTGQKRHRMRSLQPITRWPARRSSSEASST